MKAAAKRRLDQAADVLVQRLLGFALDGDTPDNIALAAIRDALDRAGLVAPKTLDVAIGPRPYEEVFDSIVTTSRAKSRAQRGYKPQPELGSQPPPEGPLPPQEDAQEPSTDPVGVRMTDEFPQIVDAEVVDPPPSTPPPRPDNGLLDFEDAVA